MVVKQLVDSKTGYLPKVIFILILILSASFIFEISQNKSINKSVLGKSIELKKKASDVSLKNIRNEGEKIYNKISASAQKEVGLVLGAFTELLSDTASKSANTAKEYIFANTVGNLLKQIDKLPTQEKELIKKEVCK